MLPIPSPSVSIASLLFIGNASTSSLNPSLSSSKSVTSQIMSISWSAGMSSTSRLSDPQIASSESVHPSLSSSSSIVYIDASQAEPFNIVVPRLSDIPSPSVSRPTHGSSESKSMSSLTPSLSSSRSALVIP